MTTYRRKSYKFFVLAIIVLIVLFLAASIFATIKKEYYIIIILFFFLLFIEGMFIMIAWIEYKSILEIGKDRIVFHYKVFSKESGLRGFNLKGLTIFWSDIKAIEIKLRSGDYIIAADTQFVQFFLKDGRIFNTSFSHFGKDKEDEIISLLKSSVPVVS